MKRRKKSVQSQAPRQAPEQPDDLITVVGIAKASGAGYQAVEYQVSREKLEEVAVASSASAPEMLSFVVMNATDRLTKGHF